MTKNRSLVRRWIQVSFLFLGAVGLSQCVDGPTAPRGARSTFGFAPSWNSRASRTMTLLDAAGLPLDRVRVILVKPIADTLADTTIAVQSGDSIPLTLMVPVASGVTLAGTLQFKSGETVLFEGKADVVTVPLSRSNEAAVNLPMEYVGPGAAATRVEVTPASGSFPTAATIAFAATALDDANTVFSNTPFDWTINDATLGTINPAGLFTPSGKGGSLIVTATTPKGLAGSATVSLIEPAVPTLIAIVSGDAQSDTILKTLANPFVVKVTDQRGDPLPGVTVDWTQLTGGGSLASASSTTNGSGLASVSYTFGGGAGVETIRASVSGLATTVTFTATAIARPTEPAAIEIMSGNAQTDTIGKPLANPFVVKVTTAAGDPLSGITVNWARLSGTGSVSNATATTNASGLASIAYTLGATAGGEVVRASVTGLTPTVSFTATAVAGKPAVLAIVSGNAQIDTILKTLPLPFVVKVSDASGNAVSGATVTWTRIGGFGSPETSTRVTDAEGLASLTYRLGDIGGADTVRAAVTGVAQTVTFTAGVRDGLGQPIVTGFAYLRVLPSPISPRVGDTVVFTADSISASGQASRVTAQWASNHPGRGTIDATGRMIIADTGSIIVTATRNAMAGHARVTALPAPKLTGFSFSPRTLNGITNAALTTSFTFSVLDAGTGITTATVTITSPLGVTKTCTVSTPTTGTARNGVFDCAMTLPAGSAAGAWQVTSLVLNGSIARTYGASALATFGSTTLTVNP